MGRNKSKGIGRGSSTGPAPAMKKSSRQSPSWLELEGTQDLLSHPSYISHGPFNMRVQPVGDYRKKGITFERMSTKEREILVYEMTYHGEGNQFQKKFPNAVSEWDFIGFYHIKGHENKKAGCRAKIIAKE